jgi:hypothetical protein
MGLDEASCKHEQQSLNGMECSASWTVDTLNTYVQYVKKIQ